MKKKIITTPFDRDKKPPNQNLLIMPLLWLVCYIQTKKAGLKINKINMKGLKPPYLVLGTHQAFADFYVTPLTIFPHRANYISELEGFEAFGEWKYRQIGCLGTRKFVNDLALVKNIQHVINKKRIMVIYPEARYANVGTNSKIPTSVGKLAKMLNVPVVTLNMKGNYLQSPIWNLTIRKEAVLEATITQIFTAEELRKHSAEEITAKVQEYLTFDEYQWQKDNKLAITYKKRAEGLELPLYQCPYCKTEFQMKTKWADILCEYCHKKWTMNQYGELEAEDGSTQYSHIPDWYEWERHQVEQEIQKGAYLLDARVRIESLPNGKNFIDLGEGKLLHNEDGFALTFQDYGETVSKTLHFPPSSMLSVHTEYDYRGKGQCITLSTLDNTYFLFPTEAGFNATKIQFATEYLYKISTKK
jgi:hypothetical protein